MLYFGSRSPMVILRTSVNSFGSSLCMSSMSYARKQNMDIFCGSASDDKSQFHDVLRVPIFISGSNLFLQKTKVVDFPLFTMKQLTSFLTVALSFKAKILKTFSSCDMPFSIFVYSPILVVFKQSTFNDKFTLSFFIYMDLFIKVITLMDLDDEL